LRLPLAFTLGWLLYDEKLDLAVMIGAVFIFAGILINLRASSAAAKRASLQQTAQQKF
jgi:drug/metabolite transporter (DMT)-like permease